MDRSMSSNAQTITATILIGCAGTLVLLKMSRLLGFAKIRYWHGKDPVILRTRGGETVSFPELCKNIIPPCRLNPFLFNGHLQSMWTAAKFDAAQIYYQRRIFEQEDPVYAGTFAVDFVSEPFEGREAGLPPRTRHLNNEELAKQGSDDNRPMLVALHGLSGGSHELYLRHVLAPLVAKEGGWEACVVNSRGCAGSELTTGILYNARATWDIRQTVRWLRKTYPNRPLYGVGFSLGANIMTNYLGEEGAGCLLKCAVVVSNPWNLEVSSEALQRGFFTREVYSRFMGNNLKELYKRHEKQITEDTSVNPEEVYSVRYLHEFDRAVQCPIWSYPTERAYYRDASSVDSMLAIRIPFLAINAEDDPMTGHEAIPRLEALQTPYSVLCTTSLGGHLSWFELGGSRWFARATCGFFQKMQRDVDFEHYSREYQLPESEVHMNGKTPVKFGYSPMRRKMHIPEQDPARPYGNP